MEHTMNHNMEHSTSKAIESGNIWTTYKPLILVGSFIIGVTALVEVKAGAFMPMRAMDHFMAGFFIFFSFFKLLDLEKFAEAFATYDVIAKRSHAYALAYPFIELALGITFALGVFSFAANLLTFAMMAVGSYGVWLVLKRQGTIQCACLGTIFNLPMTKVTLFENGIMMTMAVGSLAIHLLLK